jgi:hypothetical protein
MRRIALPAVLVALLAGGCFGGSSSPHAAISAVKAEARIDAVADLRAQVVKNVTPMDCSDVVHPAGGLTPVRYQLGVDDARMPPGAENVARAFIGVLVFPTTTDAGTCYRWLRSTPRSAYISGKLVKPKPPRKIDQYTQELNPHKPGQAGSVPGQTGEFDLDILNGHTVVFGESYNAKDAALVERDGLAVRNIVGD